MEVIWGINSLEDGMDYQVRIRYNGRRWSFGRVNEKSEQVKKNSEIMRECQRQENEGHIISTHGVILKDRFFSKKNDCYMRIIGTKSVGKATFDAIDTVKNEKTRAFKDFSRKELYELTRKLEKNGEIS